MPIFIGEKMKKENSYGIVPIRFHHHQWEILLVHHHSAHWAFPKGHANLDETPKKAAERELFEETGLHIDHYLLTDPFKEHYIFTFRGQLVSKTVEYFLALVKGKIVIQEAEIQDCQWFTFNQAFEQLTFKEGKKICQQVFELLKTFDEKGNPLLTTKLKKKNI